MVPYGSLYTFDITWLPQSQLYHEHPAVFPSLIMHCLGEVLTSYSAGSSQDSVSMHNKMHLQNLFGSVHGMLLTLVCVYDHPIKAFFGACIPTYMLSVATHDPRMLRI